MLPLLRRGGSSPAGGAARCLVVPVLPAGVQRQAGRIVVRGSGEVVTVTPDLKAVAAVPAADLADASADEILAWTARTFGDRWIVASNMQDAVLVDLAVRAKPNV